MLALLAVTTEFAAAKPWLDMADSDVVGLADPVTGETRLACILGNAREVFGVAIYRRQTGVRWLINALNGDADCSDLDNAALVDALKIELVPKREMHKEELSRLKALDFRPAGKGLVWPQFQSVQPGWLPWFIDQAEAEQLLADAPRLTSFATLFRLHPDLFDNHPPGEFPFLPNPMPDRPLQLEDLDWRPIIPQPGVFDSFKASAEQLNQLHALKRDARAAYEYGSRVVSGSSVLVDGRRSYSRVSLLVENRRGLVLGFDLSLASHPFEETVGAGLVKTLLASGALPKTLFIDDKKLEPILVPLCKQLNIELLLSKKLPGLADAQASLSGYMQSGPL
jgi:hypothetical protein